LSLRLHEEGIDERALRALAEGTGGRYFAAPEVERLPEAYRQAADEIRAAYTATLPGRRPGGVLDIYVRRDGVPLSPSAPGALRAPGLLVPEWDPYRYLCLLALLGGLLLL